MGVAAVRSWSDIHQSPFLMADFNETPCSYPIVKLDLRGSKFPTLLARILKVIEHCLANFFSTTPASSRYRFEE
jgi:hypothetical protein